MTHFKLHFSMDSYSCLFSNPLTSSVLSLVFAWVIQNAPSLSGSPSQPIIPPQRELLPISCSLQEFLHAADLCLSCTKRCSWAVSYLSDPGRGVRGSQGTINQPPPAPPPLASSSSEALQETGVLLEVCSKQHKKLLPPVSFIDPLTWLMVILRIIIYGLRTLGNFEIHILNLYERSNVKACQKLLFPSFFIPSPFFHYFK